MYANIERQSPATSPGATSVPRSDSVWETHTDAGTGRPYYYNPDTGVTTWESPFEAAEGAASPATSRTSVGSCESPKNEWDQYWDEESRRVFFYNPLTGDKVWEDESEDEDELEMQPGLSPGSPRDQRVSEGRGLVWSAGGGAGFEGLSGSPPSIPRTAGEGASLIRKGRARVSIGFENL